jgi:hypothetical protein
MASPVNLLPCDVFLERFPNNYITREEWLSVFRQEMAGLRSVIFEYTSASYDDDGSSIRPNVPAVETPSYEEDIENWDPEEHLRRSIRPSTFLGRVLPRINPNERTMEKDVELLRRVLVWFTASSNREE